MAVLQTYRLSINTVSYTHLDVYKRQNRSSDLGGDVEDSKGPPKDPIEENTYPMLVLPLRKIFVPSLVEIGPVV